MEGRAPPCVGMGSRTVNPALIFGIITCTRRRWLEASVLINDRSIFHFLELFESIMIITTGSISSRLVRSLLWTLLTLTTDREELNDYYVGVDR